MVKISEITNINPIGVIKAQVNKSVVTNPNALAKAAASITLASLGIGVSAFLKDFFKTQENNFFKFSLSEKRKDSVAFFGGLFCTLYPFFGGKAGYQIKELSEFFIGVKDDSVSFRIREF